MDVWAQDKIRPTLLLHPPTAKNVPMYLPARLVSGSCEYSAVPMMDCAQPNNIIQALEFDTLSATVAIPSAGMTAATYGGASSTCERTSPNPMPSSVSAPSDCYENIKKTEAKQEERRQPPLRGPLFEICFRLRTSTRACRSRLNLQFFRENTALFYTSS